MTTDIHIPPFARTLDKAEAKQQIRLGIQGFPGTGKTWASLTFPNPIVLNLNRGLGAHRGRTDVIEIPFYDTKIGGKRDEIKEKLIEWLEHEGNKLTINQTLIVDSLSDLHTAYHLWYYANEALIAVGKFGKINDFAEWQFKVKYFDEIWSNFLGLKCDVILLCHESERPDKPTTVGQPGYYTGKIRPLITGQVGDSMIKDFTDWYRQHSSQKPTDYTSIKSDALVNWGCKTVDEFKSIMNEFEGPTIYYWQTLGDDLFNAKASSLVNFPKFIPANYKHFNKYMRNK